MTPTPTNSASLAAWESTTVQNLNPLLLAASAEQLWDAIVAHRSTGDTAAFAVTARAIASTAGQFVRDTMERAIAALAVVTATSSAAEPAAKE